MAADSIITLCADYELYNWRASLPNGDADDIRERDECIEQIKQIARGYGDGLYDQYDMDNVMDEVNSLESRVDELENEVYELENEVEALKERLSQYE